MRKSSTAIMAWLLLSAVALEGVARCYQFTAGGGRTVRLATAAGHYTPLQPAQIHFSASFH